MGKSFKLKPHNNYKKKKPTEKIIEYMPYVKPIRIIRPVYFDFHNDKPPPIFQFDMKPSELWD